MDISPVLEVIPFLIQYKQYVGWHEKLYKPTNSQVETPTKWCAGMVVVPKKCRSVRICVDFRPFNEHFLQDPLPKVDEALTQFNGAKVFSKLDVN